MMTNKRLLGWTVLSTLALLAACGFTDQVQAQEFTHKADGQFELHLPAEGDAAWTFNGAIREGEKAQARSGKTTVDLKLYASGALAVVATDEGREVSRLYLFVRQNANFIVLNEEAVRGRTATLASDVETAVDSLEKLNKWDVNTTFQAIVAYFSINSTKQMTDFMDEVELGNITSIPRAKSSASESDDKQQEEGGEASNSEDQQQAPGDTSNEPSEDQDPRYRHMQQQPQQQQMPYGGRPPGPGYPPQGGPYGPNPMQGAPQYYYRQNPNVPPQMQQPRQQRVPRQQRRIQPAQPQQNEGFFPFNLQNPFF